MKLIIGADIVATQSNIPLFENKRTEELFGEDLLNLIKGVDFRIFNCEAALTDETKSIPKSGPSISAPTSVISGFEAIEIDLLTIGNNHILDQGVEGLNSTINVLDEHGINYVGAGQDNADARRPFVFELDGKKIGVYACCENEFSVATEDTPGANGYNALFSFDDVRELKTKVDYVIVLYHGGREHYRYPSPYLKLTCEKFVDYGADLVVTQHSHCIGCQELYHGKTIVYGQGNFLFEVKDNEYWKTGLLIEIEDLSRIIYHPIIKNGNTVRLATGRTKDTIVSDFYERSRQIQEDTFVSEQYKTLAKKELDRYLLMISGKNTGSFLYMILNKLTGGKWEHYLAKRLYHGKKRLYVLNLLRCEAHRDAIITGLNSITSNTKK